MPKTFIVLTERDYDRQDISGLYACDYEITEGDWYDFAEIQGKIRKEAFQSFVKVACTRIGIPYEESFVNLRSDSPEYMAYKAWEELQGTIFDMFKAVHNLELVSFFEVVE